MQALLATIGLVRPKAKLAPTIIDIFTATINLHLPRSVHGIPHEPGRNKTVSDVWTGRNPKSVVRTACRHSTRPSDV
jgi:hypothetical protein